MQAMQFIHYSFTNCWIIDYLINKQIDLNFYINNLISCWGKKKRKWVTDEAHSSSAFFEELTGCLLYEQSDSSASISTKGFWCLPFSMKTSLQNPKKLLLQVFMALLLAWHCICMPYQNSQRTCNHFLNHSILKLQKRTTSCLD